LASKSDYYEVLGLQQNATPEQIKAAYRKLARQHHPDANAGDPGAEERFKAINEAYAVLGEPEKRARYDRFGHAGVNGGAEGGFGGVDPFDLFDMFFGGRQRGGSRGPARGDDLRVDVQLTLEEAATGVERTVAVHRLEACKRCSGAGARMRRRCEPPSGVTDTTSPTPSTWPETMWPPSSSPSLAARSRLTGSPAAHWPRVVLARVSPDTSTANQPNPFSTTVRQQPEWEIEAPMSTPFRS